jgi:hypothetical protein
MKITILFLAVISISLAFVATNEMCRQTEIKVYSSIQPVSQSFNLDVKKIKGIEFKVNKEEFASASLIPIEQVGFVLEKTKTSQNLDAAHHKYLRNEPTSVWMPYSYTGDWTRSGYVITNQMKRTSTSKTETPLVSFEFVNDFDLMSVTGDDMDSFLANLRYNSEKRKLIKTTVKNFVQTASDSFTSSTTSLREMKSKNKDAKTQIITLKATLLTTITEINTLTTKESTLEVSEANKSAALQKINDQIDDVISKLVLLNIQLKKEEKELSGIKPTNTVQITSNMNSALSMVTYPQLSPERFLEEFTNSDAAKYKTVKDSYAFCVKDITKVQQCMEANMNTNSIQRKLRRSFF